MQIPLQVTQLLVKLSLIWAREYKTKVINPLTNNSLKHFLSQRDLNDCQKKWVSKLQAYYFDISYMKGKKNIVADALSRRLHLCSIGEIADDWRGLNFAENAKDTWAASIIDGMV